MKRYNENSKNKNNNKQNVGNKWVNSHADGHLLQAFLSLE